MKVSNPDIAIKTCSYVRIYTHLDMHALYVRTHRSIVVKELEPPSCCKTNIFNRDMQQTGAAAAAAMLTLYTGKRG